jgi:hypothetical protein
MHLLYLIMRHSIFKCYLLIIGLFLWCNGDIHSADIEVEVNTGTTYDSNVFRSFTNQKKDVYFTLAPSIALKMPFNKLYLSSGLHTTLEQHISHTEENLQELVFYGLGSYNFSDYVSFGLQDEFIISGRLGSAEKLTDVTGYREFVNNKLASSFKYEFMAGILTASFGYINTIRNYKSSDKDDWIDHAGKFQIEYFFGHKTSVSMSLEPAKKLYKIDANYINIPVIVSLKRNLTSKVDASLSLGLESRRYNADIQDYSLDKPTVVLDITGNFTRKASSKLLLQRKVYDSDILTGYAFVSTNGDTLLALNLRDDTQLILQGLYSRNSYIQIERTDNVFEGFGTIKYRLSRLGSISFRYGYLRRTSNITDDIYKRQLINLFYTVLF